LIRCNINPELGPPISKEEAGSWYTAAQKWGMTLKSLVPPLALILAVMGTILAVWPPPPKLPVWVPAGAANAGLFNRKMTWEVIRDSLPRHHEDHRHGDDALYRRQILQHGLFEHGRRRRGGRRDDRFRD
jgi:TRAP-type mannitol/chloroaromatic compound transport system permease large subunit